MNPLLATVVFVIVLFVYIHIYHNVKVSNDLEVYEVESPSKDRLEEICDIRQPALFILDMEELKQTVNRGAVTERYGAFDVNVRHNTGSSDSEDHPNISSSNSTSSQLFVPLALGAANDMLGSDNAGGIFSERNGDFLAETGLVNQLRHSDVMLRPHMVSKCSYDWLFGSDGTRTPFRYELDYRTYLTVTEGSVTLKLAPPKNSKYLYVDKDYVNFEFRSRVDPWEPQAHYKTDFGKVKCLEVVLTPGSVLYIPAYWFYSIEFHSGASLCKFSYQTYMGSLSVIHYHTLSFLQRNNTRDKLAKSVQNNETPVLNEETPILSESAADDTTEGNSVV